MGAIYFKKIGKVEKFTFSISADQPSLKMDIDQAIKAIQKTMITFKTIKANVLSLKHCEKRTRFFVEYGLSKKDVDLAYQRLDESDKKAPSITAYYAEHGSQIAKIEMEAYHISEFTKNVQLPGSSNSKLKNLC